MSLHRFTMTAAAGVLTGLAKLKRQDSARSQNRPIPASPGLGAPAPEAAPRFVPRLFLMKTCDVKTILVSLTILYEKCIYNTGLQWSNNIHF